MPEPSRATSRRALAAAAVAAAALSGAGFLVGRGTAPRGDVVAPAVPTPSPAPASTPAAPPIPVVVTPIGRAELLDAARAAADAFASGRPVPAEVAALDGRRFEIRIPFGCAGPSAADAPLGWRYDPKAEALRVRATPARFEPAEWLGAAAKGVDLIEGFWIERPWTASEACPPSPAAGGSPAPERTLAAAQIHQVGESRVGRRDGDAFQAVEKVPPDALDVAQGLRLRLGGHLAAAPGGGPVICRPPTPAGGRPVCLLAVSMDQVAIENPATGATLATWEVSSARGEGGVM